MTGDAIIDLTTLGPEDKYWENSIRVHLATFEMIRAQPGDFPRTQEALTDMLNTTGFGFEPDPVYGWSPFALLATHGHGWTGGTLPSRYVRGIPKHCYHNAWEKVRRSNSLIYCEGYAVSSSLGLPMEHAWVLDPNSGNVIEATWDTRENATFAYVGFAIPKDVVREARKRSKALDTIAVLHGDWARGGWFHRNAAEETIAYTRAVTGA